MKNLDLTYDFRRSGNALKALGKFFLWEEEEVSEDEGVIVFSANNDGDVDVYSISLDTLKSAYQHEWFRHYRHELIAAEFIKFDEDGNEVPFEDEIVSKVEELGIVEVAHLLLDDDIPLGLFAKKLNKHAIRLTSFVMDNDEFFDEELNILLWRALGI